MREFKVYNSSKDFVEIINSKFLSLPTIGDPAPTEVLTLFHYSKNKEIESFRRSSKFCWTNHISEDYDTVGDVTGLKGILFEAMYIIRVGVGTSYKPRNNNSGFMSEWALDIEIINGQFAKIVLDFDSASGVYKPV